MATLYSTKTPIDANHGLDDADVLRKRAQWGTNSVPDQSGNPVSNILNKFWTPIPWMLEAAIVFQLALGDYVGSIIVFGLLIFNAALGYFQEASAQKTLNALKASLALSVTARRNQVWTSIPATELVPGDFIRIALGDVVAADIQIIEGDVQVNQSMLTGESIPVEVGVGVQTYAGSLIQRGQAVAVVISTGVHSKYGRTAELVQSAHTVSSQQQTVMHVVRNLVIFNGCLIVVMVAYGYFRHMPDNGIIHLILTAILASIPVALPATFTLASAIGATALARLGVLPTRLSAVDEAASMDVLCSDKTGTLTCNALTISSVHPAQDLDTAHLLNYARLASSDTGKDPVDIAILMAADQQRTSDSYTIIQFTPFDPATKMAEAVVRSGAAETPEYLHILKGAFDKVAALIQPPPDPAQAGEFERQGYRVLAVAIGQPGSYKLAGLIVLTDPPRPDSAALIAELSRLGIRTVMVTGDAAETAEIVARKVGLTGANCTTDKIAAGVHPDTCSIFAGVLPEDKFKLVQIFQKQGHTVGMCGDGANDAAALHQAQIGIAVFSATDVAKSAAGIVLTRAGLTGIVDAIKEGRITYQRILTYTLNSMTKKVVQILFLAVGLFMTGEAILTPMLMAIIMIAGDFLGMSLTTDNVNGSSRPNSWHIEKLTIAGLVMGLGELMFCVAMLWVGMHQYQLNIDGLRTLAFVTIVFANQGTTYNNRTRSYLWTTRPSNWLLASSTLDIGLAATLAMAGLLMTPIPAVLVLTALGGSVVYTLLLDQVKVPLFAHLKIA